MSKPKRGRQHSENVDATVDLHGAKRMLRVSGQTIYNWRTKTGPHERPLPALLIPGTGRPALRFVVSEIEQWAKENRKKVYAIGRR